MYHTWMLKVSIHIYIYYMCIYIYRELEDPGSFSQPTDPFRRPKKTCRDCSGVDSGYQGSITLSYLGQAALRIPFRQRV